MKRVQIHCDGSCLAGIYGGYAAILQYGEVEKVISGVIDGETTNQRMEIIAAYNGLKALTEPCKVTVYSDSQYLVQTMNGKFKIKANHSLWEHLKEVTAKHKVRWKWVKGHAGHPLNERADKIAREAAESLQHQEQRYDNQIATRVGEMIDKFGF